LTDSDSANGFQYQVSDSHARDTRAVTIVGAGPAGALLAILLAQRNYRVTVLERLPDLRHSAATTGRSINLALADRGIHALRCAGVLDDFEPLLIPMRGRMLHDPAGHQSLLHYGSQPHEVIYSISRNSLNAALLNHAERTYNVELRFRQTCISVDAAQNALCMQDIPTGRLYALPLQHVIGADGAGSVLRRFLVEVAAAGCNEDMLSHGYKEITLPAGDRGAHQLNANALHVWPRGEFMLIALPNLDGSFTATLFLPHDGPVSFSALASVAAVEDFFRCHFADACALVPDLGKQFLARPTGSMGTVRCDRWTLEDKLILIGDAAHAVVPFHGQGMNCAFEDCVELAALLDSQPDWQLAGTAFQNSRKANTDAIADMALENYIEMRDTVRQPKFQLQKELSLELEKRFPTRFIPRYSMVMFHHEIPYSVAYARGKVQDRMLSQLTTNASELSDVDFRRAEASVLQDLSELDVRNVSPTNPLGAIRQN